MRCTEPRHRKSPGARSGHLRDVVAVHIPRARDAPARLALQYDAPLIPISLRRDRATHFTLKAHDPIPIDKAIPRNQAVRDASLKMNQFLEDTIRAAPDQWFWVHRRWPKETWKKAGVL